MKEFSVLFKYTCITLILIISVVVLDMIIRMEWPGGIDSFFLAIGFYLVFYFLPVAILTALLDVFVIKKTTNRWVRYAAGLVVGGIMIAFHVLFILKGKVITEKHAFVMYEALFIGIAAVFLNERLFNGKRH